MTNLRSLPFTVFALVLMGSLGCSADEHSTRTSVGSAGGTANANGGTTHGTAGIMGTGGVLGTAGGSHTGTGGRLPGPGGASGIGGTVPGTGGVQPATGGTQGSGGSTPATGGTGTGASTGTGGTETGGTGTGGTGTGGTGTGGTATGGTGTGGIGTGGTGTGGIGTGGIGTGGIGTGGTGTGGIGTGGTGTGGTTTVDPNASAAIDACMLQLPWGAPDLSEAERAPIVNAIINTCVEFAPPGDEWQTWCQMFLVAAINAESSYDVLAGSVGAGNDPTVGLLQIRFSSTVIDFADYGPVDALARIGCDFGTVTDSDSYATKSEMMLDVNCNIAIGAWYYFIFGSGNGGDDAVWVWEYCMGGGVAGNLHIGMACHLMGAEAAHSSLSGADYYYNQIQEWFDPCVSYSGTHPFERTIEPDMGKYCG